MRYRHFRHLLVNDFDCEAIRQTIYYLSQVKEHVTLAKLLVVLKEDNIFYSQRSTLHILLKEIGFKWVTIKFVMMPISIVLYRHKRIGDRRHYYEQPCIIKQRDNYLHLMLKNWQENWPVVYFDKTWPNAYDGKDCAWVKRDDVTHEPFVV